MQLAQVSPEELQTFKQRCTDPIWRLHNLYKIKDKSGKIIPFRPTPEQSLIIDAIYAQKLRRIIILKARQMGFSTLIDLLLFDATYWTANTKAAIVDQTQPAAHIKLKEKARFALQSLPPELQEIPKTNNDSELVFTNESSLIAGKNIRGGTYQLIHISEWGPIAHEDPRRSEEIKTGALPAAERGIIIVESTFKGGKGGHLYDIIKQAQEIPPDLRTPDDWHLFFFPWYRDTGYVRQGDPRSIPPDVNAYLDEKEQELGITFTPEQRLWYSKTKADQGIHMFREYPTTIEEAFAAPVEGAIYGDLISKIRANNQIHDFLPDPSYPVYTAWDIGWADETSVWLFQIIGRDIYFIHHIRDRQLTAAQAWARITATGHPIAANILPHDAGNTTAAAGVSYQSELARAGATHITILPRTRDIWAGINAARDLIPRSYFHKTHCAAGIEALEAYHTKDTHSGTYVTRDPVHDWSSHDADSFRYAAEALRLGLIKTSEARRQTLHLNRPIPLGARAAAREHIKDEARDMSQWARL